MAKIPKFVDSGGKAPAKFLSSKKKKGVPFFSFQGIVFPDVALAYNPLKTAAYCKYGPDPVWSFTAPNYNDDGTYTGSTPWYNTSTGHWEWGGPNFVNYVQNSKFEGAGIGVSPIGWNAATTTTNGITREIIGVGPAYIDYRISGTATGSTVYVGVGISSGASPIAALSETWTGIAKVTLLSGDWSAVSPRVEMQEVTSASAYLVSSSTPLVGKSGQAVSHTRTFSNASVGKSVLLPFMTSITVNTTVDFVVRIEQPQLTKTATVMPYVATGIGETVTVYSVPQPRVDAGNGLWIGGQVTNLDAYLSSYNAFNATINNGVISSTTNGWARLIKNFTVVIGSVYTRTISAEKKSGYIFVSFYFDSKDRHNIVNLTTGEITINSYGDFKVIDKGLYFEINVKFTATTTTIGFFVGPCSTGASHNSIVGEYVKILYNQYTATSYPLPYVPPGATQPSNAATTGGNGVNIPLDAGLLECFRGKTVGVELNNFAPIDVVTTTAYATLRYRNDLQLTNRYIIKLQVDTVIGGALLIYAQSSSLVLGITSPGTYTYETIPNGINTNFAITPNSNGMTVKVSSISIQRLLPAVCTAMTEHYMGVGSAELAEGQLVDLVGVNNSVGSVLSAHKYTGLGRIVRLNDGSNAIVVLSEWSANEIHRRYVQTTSDGTRFRVGYQRYTSAMVEITSGIQWSHTGAESTWAAFDGSFNPLLWLRFGLNLTVSVWMRSCWISNKSLYSEEINLRNIKIANL